MIEWLINQAVTSDKLSDTDDRYYEGRRDAFLDVLKYIEQNRATPGTSRKLQDRSE